MRLSIAITLLVALAAQPAAAQTSSAAHAAALASAHARAVTLRDLRGGRSFGTVTLQPIGRTRTRVTLRVAGTNQRRAVVTLHRGTDCNDNRFNASARAFTLNPVSAASQTSQTIVEVPLSALQSGDYLVDVRNATQSTQFRQACARLGR